MSTVKERYSSSISSKGQVTVPQEIRNRLGLSSGDRVEFVIEGEHTIIRPSRPRSNPFAEYAGILGTFPGGKKEINAWLRDLRSEDDSSEK
jgi:antitoxin PrlF